MQIIKEIRLAKERYEAICVVRSDCYGSKLNYIHQLAAAAKETYPNLTDNDIRVVRLGGDRYARTFGIEFDCPDPTARVVPHGWTEIEQLEMLL